MQFIKYALLIIGSMLIGAALFQLNNDANSNQDAAALTTPAAEVKATVRPEFSLPDLDNANHNISEWDGKLLLINFWASWCPPCIKEMPALDELRNEFLAEGFEILGVAIEPPSDVQVYLTKSPVSYPILHGEITADRIARDYGNDIGSIPFSVLIDPNGKIVERYYGEIELTLLTETIKTQLSLQR